MIKKRILELSAKQICNFFETGKIQKTLLCPNKNNPYSDDYESFNLVVDIKKIPKDLLIEIDWNNKKLLEKYLDVIAIGFGIKPTSMEIEDIYDLGGGDFSPEYILIDDIEITTGLLCDILVNDISIDRFLADEDNLDDNYSTYMECEEIKSKLSHLVNRI